MTEYKLKVYGDYTECRNQDGKRHRLENDGPAIEWSNGTKLWYINGVRHRENGPAIEYANGSKSWWINGQKYSEQSFIKNLKPFLGKKVVVDGIEYILS